MRISDWSSDGCSSDLHFDVGGLPVETFLLVADILHGLARGFFDQRLGDRVGAAHFASQHDLVGRGQRFAGDARERIGGQIRSEEHTSELQSLMRISYAVFCLKKKKRKTM